jgi:AcrR family transcriptional regulator
MPEPSQARSLATLEKILTAAEAVVAREGVGGLTMDGVAHEAGISKGGVLHHFRAKEALIAKLATRKLEQLRGALDQHVGTVGEIPQKTLNGMIDHGATTYGRDDGFSRAMLMAAVEHSASLELFRSTFEETFTQIRAESAQPDAAVALLFAVIGVMTSKTLGIANLDRAQADAVFRALKELAASLPARKSRPAAPAQPDEKADGSPA